ncbi:MULTISPECIES: DUF2147 domain-containing protein [Sphingopyxis]|uniref:Uncharacterized protein (DUF2147 family) n=1 Tax=Sphingopyxis panaciterrulae TaxID=462372 RepID=A0A7W9B930_9SPHN|nr:MULTISPECIES: DUF2147 domain-containing protein [Sphingopyxis]MBB5708455.1 uncharacterized protein (DUF2147 family) [Sphingopyxis panaciterrulae]HEX2813640.1 DUF2147 domain-containing protein [Sphingopyxis sp.]
MKKILLATTLIVAAGGGAAAASQGSGGAITGLWSTGSQGGRVELYRCGTAICGKVDDAAPLRANPNQRDVKNPDPALRDRRLKGLVVLRGFKGGPREWKGGPVYDPETGDGAAKGYLTLRADGKLEVKGCKAAIFCRTKVWTRVR